MRAKGHRNSHCSKILACFYLSTAERTTWVHDLYYTCGSRIRGNKLCSTSWLRNRSWRARRASWCSSQRSCRSKGSGGPSHICSGHNSCSGAPCLSSRSPSCKSTFIEGIPLRPRAGSKSCGSGLWILFLAAKNLLAQLFPGSRRQRQNGTICKSGWVGAAHRPSARSHRHVLDYQTGPIALSSPQERR